VLPDHVPFPPASCFLQTSQGIALTPNHDTFDLADALAEPIGMMKGLQYGSGGEVTLLPLSPTICKQVRRPACATSIV